MKNRAGAVEAVDALILELAEILAKHLPIAEFEAVVEAACKHKESAFGCADEEFCAAIDAALDALQKQE